MGTEVVVPFGNRHLKGYVVKITNEKTVEDVRDIKKRGNGFNDLTLEQVELSFWLSDYYLCPMILALKTVSLSAGLVCQPKKTVLEIDKKQAASYLEKLSKRARQQQKLLEVMLSSEKGLTASEIAKISGVSLSTINVLKRKGILKEVEKEIKEENQKDNNFSFWSLPELSKEREELIDKILVSLKKEEAKTILLRQDKKEKFNFYLNLAAKVLETGYQVIILIPEITFAPEIVEFFKRHFGETAAIFHSALSPKERYYNLKRIKEGRAGIVIGTRSAIFAPLNKPKLFIIDEEAEITYRQENDPKYHAREVALWRANYNRGLVLLTSLTPSLESYYEAKKGNYDLKVDTDLKNPAEIKVVDMRQEFKKGNPGIFSVALKNKLQETFKKNGRAALLVNRRGYAGLLLCRDCGKTLECPHCSVSLVYHKQDELRCHYCNYRNISPQTCPYCGSRRLRFVSWGTQRAEEEIRTILPEIKVIRIDSDVVKNLQEDKRIKKQLCQNDVQLLIGTQMLFKYIELVDIQLAGIINIDSILYLPDFRGREKVIRTLAKIAFSPGDKKEIIVQTYNPKEVEFLVDALYNYDAFYYHEIQRRFRYNYPPFTHLARLLTISRKSEWAEKAANDLSNLIKEENKDNLKILGPAPAAIFKLKDRYRWQVTVKGEKRQEIKIAIAKALARYTYSTRKLALSIDLDPF